MFVCACILVEGMQIKVLQPVKIFLAGVYSLALIFMVSTMHMAAASPMQTHSMEGMRHGKSGSACATLCSTAVLGKDESVVAPIDDEDLEPSPPTVVKQISFADADLNQQPANALGWRPLKVPIFLANQVLRI